MSALSSAKTNVAMPARRGRLQIKALAFWFVNAAVMMSVGWLARQTSDAFHDAVITQRANEQVEIQFAYEDRIAELRTQIDRITSGQLVDQGKLEQKLDALLKRQELLEQRTSALSGNALPRKSVRGHLSTPALSPPNTSNSSTRSDKVSGLNQILARVSYGLDDIEQGQMTMLTSMEKDADSKLRRIHEALAEIGVNPHRAPPSRGVGGPFIAVKTPRSEASAFDRQLYHMNVTRAEFDRYHQILETVPVRKPVTGDIDMSSLFGVRSDPFFHRPAMHTGLDLRGDTGEPVRAAASGRIVFAGRDGGYGNLIEINHGNGLATRYGHLSEISVKIGQRVQLGQIIGKIGSTGRSTGPHLHYETRANGRPLDPQKFLNAGSKLGNL